MSCESASYSIVNEDDGESDEEIKKLRAKIEKKKMARRKRSTHEEGFTDNMSMSTKSTGTSLSSCSPRSSLSLSTLIMFYYNISVVNYDREECTCHLNLCAP